MGTGVGLAVKLCVAVGVCVEVWVMVSVALCVELADAVAVDVLVGEQQQVIADPHPVGHGLHQLVVIGRNRTKTFQLN